MKIIESLMTENPCYKEGRTIQVIGLMLHSVGVPQPNASVFINSWNKSSYNRACVHAFIDGNTGYVYQTLPWNHRGWHGGGSSNNLYIGVEMCEPSTIKYVSGSGWVELEDGKNTEETIMRTYNSAVELFAHLCDIFQLHPLQDGAILSHKEGHARGIASDHGDPEHVWEKFGLNMNQFRRDVFDALQKLHEKPNDNIKDNEEMVETVNVRINGNSGTADAIMKDDTTYIKLRSLEDFGFKVDYDAETKTRIVDNTIKDILVNVNDNDLNLKGIFANDTNYVKLREICESLNASVHYDNDTKKITIKSN